MPASGPRNEARKRGLNRYFTGKACKLGHVAQRKTVNGDCVECVRVKAPRYLEKKRDREKRRKSTAAYKAGRAARERKYYQSYPEKRRAKQTRYYRKHLKKQRQRSLRYYYDGPQKPDGELQWLRKNRAQLRALKRALKASPSQSAASTQAPNSQA